MLTSGYVYDPETGLYYLQSRYYDPEVGRFLNADAFTSTGQGILGNNMFAYCGNNPVLRFDSSGHFFFTAVGAIVGATFGALDAVIQGKTDRDFWGAVASEATSGAISGLATDILSFTGATVGAVVGVMAVVGAVGSLAANRVEDTITGSKTSRLESASGMIADAALNGLFAYMGGPVASQMGKIAKKGLINVAKNFYKKELKNIASNIAEEALTTITSGIAKFTGTAYMRFFESTRDLWLR